MKSSAFPLFILLLVAVVTTTPAFAGGRKSKAPPAPEHHETVISNVGPTALTVTQDHATRTFTITPFTEVTLNGQKAGVADLKPGMKVSVTLGMDASKASRINASGAPK